MLGSSFLYTVWTMSWQVALAALVVWVICKSMPKAPAAWRHFLWLVVLVKFFVPPFAHLPSQVAFQQFKNQAPIVSRVSVNSSVEASKQGHTRRTLPDVPSNTFSGQGVKQLSIINSASIEKRLSGVLAAGWLVGFSMMSAMLIIRKIRQQRIISSAAGSDNSKLTHLLEECAAQMGLRVVPEIRLPDEVLSPALVGVTRPVILFPAALVESSTNGQLKAMLLHELAHIRRKDMWVFWLQQIARLVFFFHPVIWLAGRELTREAEMACDELVLSKECVSRRDYAAGYLSALKLANGAAGTPVSLAMAESFGDEKRRLEGMLHNNARRISGLAVAVLLLLAGAMLSTFAGTSKEYKKASTDTKWTVPFNASAKEPKVTITLPDSQDKIEKVGVKAVLLAGMTPVAGPGLEVELQDSKQRPKSTSPEVLQFFKVHDSDIRNVVLVLWSAGAQAISINGRRLVTNSVIEGKGSTITVDKTPIKLPVLIKATGVPGKLSQAVWRKRGVGEQLKILEMIKTRESSRLLIPAFDYSR